MIERKQLQTQNPSYEEFREVFESRVIYPGNRTIIIWLVKKLESLDPTLQDYLVNLLRFIRFLLPKKNSFSNSEKPENGAEEVIRL